MARPIYTATGHLDSSDTARVLVFATTSPDGNYFAALATAREAAGHLVLALGAKGASCPESIRLDFEAADPGVILVIRGHVLWSDEDWVHAAAGLWLWDAESAVMLGMGGSS